MQHKTYVIKTSQKLYNDSDISNCSIDTSKPNVCINQQPYVSKFSDYKLSVYPHLFKKIDKLFIDQSRSIVLQVDYYPFCTIYLCTITFIH